jgi:hypothetical protein
VAPRPLVLLATCGALPLGDIDDADLPDALAEAGLEPRWQVWDDPAADWTSGTTVLRSTWDYTLHRDRFLAWIDRLPSVHNSPEVVRWNSDKRYLLELAGSGVPVTPTEVVERGAPLRLPADGDVVLKPAVGAGSRGAGRFGMDESDRAHQHAARLHAAGRTVLLQPYLDGVDERGETAIVAFGGRIDHAARKGPMLETGAGHEVTGPSLFIEEDISPRAPDWAEIAVAERALAFLERRFGAPLPYARIDLLPSPDGPVVVELEVVEPSLFFGCSPGSPARWAAAVAAAVNGAATTGS